MKGWAESKNPVLEKLIEKYLCQRVRARGGIPYKFMSPGRRNVPDRLCLFPQGELFFVECKAPGKTPTDGQWREIARLQAFGFEVYVVTNYAEVDEIWGARL